MSRPAEFNRLAERELDEAAQYYELESLGLGTRFLDEIRTCIDSIIDHPESGRILLGVVRRRLVRSFPYGVLYSVKPQSIRILAIMHLKRRPMYWVDRK